MWRKFEFNPPLDLEAGTTMYLLLDEVVPSDDDSRSFKAVGVQAALSEAFTECPN